MIRTFTTMSVAVLLIAGCGSSGTNDGTGGNGGGSGSSGMDLSAPPGSDLSMTLPPDMQPAYGCHALAACEVACASSPQTCTTCIASATMNARTLYSALRSCIRKECNPHPDAGPAPCTQGGGGTPSPQCLQCQADVIKMAGTCNGDPMYCGTCYSQYAACQADLP